ncbi:tetratricopeptide repeat protein [uncultured Nostoc sp.]|uniref:tetratricopeptide repeat protein n=1 Tax=uncultured Nostoc sp. TaxID=340711 RepID=UPI0035CB9537
MEFIGREAELQNLHQMLQENNQVVIAAIAGMGGLGKTELALQYAIAHREIYKGGICWLLAKAGDVGIQVVQFARTQLDLNPPEDLDLLAQVQYCFRLWREGNVLLVLDDVGEYQQVKPYLPSSSSRFKVLITTRQHLGASIKVLSLDVLQPKAALELLKSFFKETPQRIEQELAVANQLCEWLGYLPLGLELVGRYLARKQDLSFTEMLRRLEKKRLEQPALVKPEADMTAQGGVLAAFELSWQELEDSDKQLGCLLSLFAAAPISWKLVEQCLPEKDEEELEEIRDDTLLKLHLLQRKGEGIYQLHPLLREFFQYKLTGLEQAEELKRSLCRVMVAVAKKIPQNPMRESIMVFSPAIPHIADVGKNLTEYLTDEELTSPFIGLGRFYVGQAFYDQVTLWLEQCLTLTLNRFDSEHPTVATSLENLGLTYFSQGSYTKAEQLLLQALEIRQRQFGEQYHPQVAYNLNALGMTYCAQRRYKEAELFYFEALKFWLRHFGEQHLDIALSLNNIAHLYYCQERYNKAEPFFVQALELRRFLLPEQHPDVAQSLNNLAAVYFYQGRYQEAEPLYVQALNLLKDLLPEQHPNIAQSLNNLARLYQSQSRYKEAEPLYVQAFEIYKRTLESEHPQTIICWNNYIMFLRQAILDGRANLDLLRDDPLGQVILEAIQAEREQSKD